MWCGRSGQAFCAARLCSPLLRGWVCRTPLATGNVMSQGIIPAFLNPLSLGEDDAQGRVRVRGVQGKGAEP